jgi:hypothetical protein
MPTYSNAIPLIAPMIRSPIEGKYPDASLLMIGEFQAYENPFFSRIRPADVNRTASSPLIKLLTLAS